MFSALITQPLPHGPDWPLIAGRQLAIFVNGLTGSGPNDIPGPPVTRQDIEATFTGESQLSDDQDRAVGEVDYLVGRAAEDKTGQVTAAASPHPCGLEFLGEEHSLPKPSSRRAMLVTRDE